jgi:hypothetical protein
MGPRNAYKDMLDNVDSPITCVSMNHQNQLEQMANGAISATRSLSCSFAVKDTASGRSVSGGTVRLTISDIEMDVAAT